ncbi:MAG: hypothetical protein RIB69_14215 [Roseovarius sp.]
MKRPLGISLVAAACAAIALNTAFNLIPTFREGPPEQFAGLPGTYQIWASIPLLIAATIVTWLSIRRSRHTIWAMLALLAAMVFPFAQFLFLQTEARSGSDPYADTTYVAIRLQYVLLWSALWLAAFLYLVHSARRGVLT